MARDIRLDPARLSFSSPYDMEYEAKVADITGRIRFRKSGKGAVTHEFEIAALEPGIYLLSVRIGTAAIRKRRHAITHRSP